MPVSAVSLTTQERLDLSNEIRRTIRCEQLTYNWLIHQLAMDGLFTDKTEMSSVMAGARSGRKADNILVRSVKILRDYQAKM